MPIVSNEELEQLREQSKQRPSIDGKTVLLGGGIIALIAFLFFRGGGGTGIKADKKPLTFKLRATGLMLGDKPIAVDEAIARVLAGKRRDALLQPSGDVRQGDVDFVTEQFQKAGVSLSVRQLSASVYQRGLGGFA